MTPEARRIERTMTVLAAIVASVIVVALPSVYFTISYHHLLGALETEAEVSASQASRLVAMNPSLWFHQEIRLRELLDHRPSTGTAEVRRILNLEGRVVAESRDTVEGPLVSSGSAVYDAGDAVARVEVATSLRPMLLETLGITVVALLLAWLVFGTVRIIPLRAIKQAHASLERSEKRYRSLYDTMREGIALYRVSTDAGGGARSFTVVDVNPAFAAMVGRDRASLSGVAGEEVLDGALVPYLPDLARVVTTGQPFSFELTTNDGARTFQVSASSPQSGHFATLFEDVTARREAEEKQLQLQAQLGESQKMESIGRLAGGVAHDLNNLLSPILGYAGMLLADAPAGTQQAEDLREIERSAERARDLVTQLLAFGRKQLLDMHTVDLRVVMSGFEKLLRRTIREDVKLELHLPLRLAPVRADAGQIEQVVLNLAVNAQHAMPDGGRLVLELAEEQVEAGDDTPRGIPPGRWVVLRVSDTGRGIEPLLLERIFEPFFTTKKLGEGTGLGLSIVHGIVSQHDGHVLVDSDVGRGTTFSIFLPAVAGPAEPALERPSRDATPLPRGRETILVAEDEEAVRRVTVRTLEDLGYRVIAAEDATSCLALSPLELAAVDLLLTDVVMPDMNGRQLYERLSTARPALKVAFMSGYPGDVLDRHGVRDDTVLLLKPFTAQALADTVRRALGE